MKNLDLIAETYDRGGAEIDALVEGYVAGIEGQLGRKLTWEHDDLALQNIQARVRAPS